MILMLGAHMHRQAVEAPYSDEWPDLDLKIIVTTAVVPVYTNNPSYTVLELKTEDTIKIDQIYFHNFQLQSYILFKAIRFVKNNLS